MIRTILLILLLSTAFSEGSFYISLNESTWYAYNRYCTPATPKVTAADTDYQVDENLGINISPNDHVWTGYYQVVRVFQYIAAPFLKIYQQANGNQYNYGVENVSARNWWDNILDGCASMKDLNNYKKRPFVEIKGDPGHCFPACGDETVIGVTRTRCYCLGSELNIQNKTEAGCIQRCNGPSVACGKDSTPMKYAYLSIYKMNTNVTTTTIAGSSKETNCLTMDPTVPKTFIWNYCKICLPPMCEYGDNVRMITSGDSIKYFPWTGAANACFANKAFPTTYSNSKNVNRQEGSQLWTGMFKTSVVYRHNAYIPGNRRHDTRKFGYLTRDSDNNVKLQFSDTDSNKRRLCDDGKHDKRGTSPSSTKLSPTTTTNITDTSAKSSFGTVVILALCGSMVLISVVIVLLVCFLNRRKKNRPIKQCDKTNLVPSNRKNDTDNSAKISFQGDFGHVVLEQKGNLNDNRNDTYDTAIEDIVSYTKKHIQDYSKSNEKNFYNQLADETTYDHAITTNQINRSNSCENEIDQTYDNSIVTTTINVDRRLTENIYNQSGVDEEDEYNHFGPKDKNLKTDNVYGVAQGKVRENMDNEYDLSISRHCKDTSNGHIDNTYSCLSDNSNN